MVFVVGQAQDMPKVEVVGPWQVRVSHGVLRRNGCVWRIRKAVDLAVSPSSTVHVRDEKYDALPVYQESAAPWGRGERLRALITYETTAAGLLAPESLVLKSGPGESARLVNGKDYAFEQQWATFGRIPGGWPEGKPVWADYDAGLNRIDSVVVSADGAVSIRQGDPHNATPHPPAVRPGEAVIANVWIPGRLRALGADNVYPITEPAYHAPHRARSVAQELLPKTWAKLHSGEPLHIVAWGDSVTAGGQASDEAHQYQSRFVSLLRARFRKAKIRLTTAGWGGRNSDSFLHEPPGAEHNFDLEVIGAKPDLVVMEFVNDAYLTPGQVEERYSYLLKRFQEIGAEWIILTPHFVRPDWMGEKAVRVESDPRPYVAGVREFCARHHVALADASLRWGHLMKEGIPYTTLLSNSINHPDDRGHDLFAQSLMELFTGR